MLGTKKIIVVMPAYNAEKTLERTVNDLPEIIDDVIVVDDYSRDNTQRVAETLGVHYVRHDENKGYGGNQKTCYQLAIERGADLVIMVHPDYQYSPKLTGAMAEMLCSGHYDVVLGSRILGRGAILGGMPRYKYIANRILTLIENILLNQKLSEYHTGYRGFTREVLETIPFSRNSDDFVFDNQMLAQVMYYGFQVGEISCPTRYFAEASSINLPRSVRYGFGVLHTALRYRLAKWGLAQSRLFPSTPGRLSESTVVTAEMLPRQ